MSVTFGWYRRLPFSVALKILLGLLGDMMQRWAAALKHMPVMDACRDIVGGTRAFAHGMHGTQDGVPAKAARAIDLALGSDTTPLRLQLGADSVDSVRVHAESLLSEMAIWESVARETAIEKRACCPSSFTGRGTA